MDGSSGYGAVPERGARRRKLAGYLKTANELRQSYQQAYGFGAQRDGTTDGDSSAIPGSFPEGSVVRSGEDEMLLFPSYAIRHSVKKPRRREEPGASQDIRSEKDSGNAEYWKKEWDRYEKESSVIEVDIRGWIYSPHRGQMTRKNRLLIGIARQLSGIPAPASDRASSPQSPHHTRVEERNTRREEEMVEKEAESITRRGQGEADIAWQGRYSEDPSRQTDQSSLHEALDDSRSPSPVDSRRLMSRPLSNSSLRETSEHELKPLAKRSSWRQPSDMTSAELSVANAHLMTRLKPFLTIPLTTTPLTVFFYNDETSKSRTIITDEAGHFSLRAALDFIPTNVRVLASDKLSATEEVRITEPSGVSMISDIDDTIKHSGIGSGAREIFRNAFIRDLSDLTISGVKEWYSTMSGLGVTFHYVSNSPWQLYPVLVSYFEHAGLPKGSFHLKQYSGMLQGIFEPVAERKKGTLEKILSDFPQRRFILAGDSGEADLELYTDIMLANPGRIIGVFIRDVTTTKALNFFDHGERTMDTESSLRGRRLNAETGVSGNRPVMSEEKPPALPPRLPSNAGNANAPGSNGPQMGTLIDFDEPSQGIHGSQTDTDVHEASRKLSTASIDKSPPPLPSKPQSLRSLTGDNHSGMPSIPNSVHRKPAPPLPPKPRQLNNTQEVSNLPAKPSPLSQTQNASNAANRAISLDRDSYRTTVRNKVASASNALYNVYNGTSPPAQGQPSPSDSSMKASRPPPPVPPRRNVTSYPAAATQYASDRISDVWNGYSNNGSVSSSDTYRNTPVLSKKEEMWARRWARAKGIFEERGVVLKTWRVGADVADEAVRLVDKANKNLDD
ncbi:hypothetical protein ACLMJK_003741 [Lecanora helva]